MDGWTDGRMEVVILREEGSFNFFVSRVLSNLIDPRGIYEVQLNLCVWIAILGHRSRLQYFFTFDFFYNMALE